MKRYEIILIIIILIWIGTTRWMVMSTTPMDPQKMRQKITECESRSLEYDIIYWDDENLIIRDIQCFPTGRGRG